MRKNRALGQFSKMGFCETDFCSALLLSNCSIVAIQTNKVADELLRFTAQK